MGRVGQARVEGEAEWAEEREKGEWAEGFRPKGGWGFLIVLSIDLIPVIHLGFRK